MLTPLVGVILDVNIQMIVNANKTNPDGIMGVAKNMLTLRELLE